MPWYGSTGGGEGGAGELVGTVGFRILRANNCRCEILSVSRQAMESMVAQGIPSASARIVALLLSIEVLSKTERVG